MKAKQAKEKALLNKKKIEDEEKRLAPQRAKEAAERARQEDKERKKAIASAVDRLGKVVEPDITASINDGRMSVTSKITTSEIWETGTGMNKYQLLDYYKNLLETDGYAVVWEQTVEEDHEGPGIFRFKVSWDQ